MSGIFSSLNTANKGLMAQQTALHTTGHNIANANTEGYSRQRVDLKSDLSFNLPGVGQLGTGVRMEAVERIVNMNIERQIRGENGILKEFKARSDVMEQLEAIFNEPSDTSLNFNISEMFDAWQELSKNPESLTSKTIVVEKSRTLADTYNHMLNQIDSLEEEVEDLLGKNIKDFNSILDQVETLNKQIFNIAVKGNTPNDLLDQRDLLLKDLSSISNVQVDHDQYGRTKIELGDKTLLDYKGEINKLELDTDGEISIGIGDDDGGDLGEYINKGEIRGRLDALKDIKIRRDDLKKFGEGMAKAINTGHGYSIDDQGNKEGQKIFNYDSDKGRLNIDLDLLEDPSLIQPGKNKVDEDGGAEGDGSRALAISRLRNTRIDFDDPANPIKWKEEEFELEDDPNGNTIGGYYNDMVAEIGISKEHADNMVANQEAVVGQLDLRRESVSGVSIDEEITNMLKYQSAYGANARVISTLTEMLDTLINRMGV